MPEANSMVKMANSVDVGQPSAPSARRLVKGARGQAAGGAAAQRGRKKEVFALPTQWLLQLPLQWILQLQLPLPLLFKSR
jgi:hypothetical protein